MIFTDLSNNGRVPLIGKLQTLIERVRGGMVQAISLVPVTKRLKPYRFISDYPSSEQSITIVQCKPISYSIANHPETSI